MRAAFVRMNATICWLCGKEFNDPLRDPAQADHVQPGEPTSILAPAHRSCNAIRKDSPATPEQMARLASVVTA